MLNRNLLVGIIISVFALVGVAAQESSIVVPATAEPTQKDWSALDWHDDFEAAKKKAQEENKPLYVDFTSSRCGYCRKLESQTYSDPKIWEELNKSLVLCQLNVTQNQELARRYDALATPTLYLFSPSGATVFRWKGFLDPNKFPLIILSLAQSVPLIEAYEKECAKGDPESIKASAAKLRDGLPPQADLLGRVAWELLTLHKNSFKSAAVMAKKAYESAPGQTDLLDTLAYAQLGAGEYDDAITHYRSLAKENYENAHTNLALALAARSGEGDADEAVKVLQDHLKKQFGK